MSDSHDSLIVTLVDIVQFRRHLLSSIAMLNKNNQTPTMGAKLAADRLSLTKLISNFYRERLRLLEPCELDSIYTDRPESAPLYLPSDAPFGSPRSLKAVALGETEAAMRFAHAFDAIEAIRIGLGVRASLWRYKVDQVTGYGATSRTGTLVSDAQGRIASSATCYRDNRAAYLRLKGSGEWDNMLRPLNHEDLRPMAEPDDKALLDTGVIGKGKGKGRVDPKEGHRTVSWIWYSYGDDDSPEGSMQKGQSYPIPCPPLASNYRRRSSRPMGTSSCSGQEMAGGDSASGRRAAKVCSVSWVGSEGVGWTA